MYLLTFYVPETHCESVKTALFKKGAGRYEKYDCCAWQVQGEGQYRPMEGSKPFLGQEGTVEKVSEFKVEMICDDSIIVDVLEELIKVHPYEEPAYTVCETKTIDDFRE
jgi:hypothetical protein